MSGQCDVGGDEGEARRLTGLAAAARRHLLQCRQASLAELAQAVFSPPAGAPLTLYTRLTEQLLQVDARFRCGEDGLWRLVEHDLAEATPAERQYVVLQLAATGQRPGKHRLLELAALRLNAAGEVTAEFASLFNPERRAPQYYLRATGYNAEDLAQAPVFAAVAEQLMQFCAGATLVGHGIALQLAHLAHELRLLGRPPLSNPTLDTLELGQRQLLLPGKPTLAALARACGVAGGQRRRAMDEARLVTRVFARLLRQPGQDERPQQQGERLSYPLLAGRAQLSVAEAPGVYLLHEAAGEVVYVGKAANLQQRLQSYFSTPHRWVRQMEGLTETVTSSSVRVCGSELAALLLEWQLINELRPRFNTQYRYLRSTFYLRLDPAAEYPRLTAVSDRRQDGARYWGPMPNAQSMLAVREQLNRFFPLRQLRRQLPAARLSKKKRLLLAADRPAQERIAHYRALVAELLSLLDGEPAPLLARLERELAAAREAGDAPAVTRLAALLREARLFEWPVEGDGPPSPGGNLALLLPAAAAGRFEAIVLAGDAFGGSTEFEPALWAERELAGRLRRAVEQAVRDDRVEIVARWLAAHPQQPTVALPRGSRGWLAAARQLLRLARQWREPEDEERFVSLEPDGLPKSDDWAND